MSTKQNSQQTGLQSYFVWFLLAVCILDIALSSVYGLLVSLNRINPGSSSLLILQVAITVFVLFGSGVVAIQARKRSSDPRLQAEQGSQILRDFAHEVDLLIERKAGRTPLTTEQRKLFEGRRRNIFRKLRGSADMVITRIRHLAARISLLSILASLLFGGGLLLLPTMARYVHELSAAPWLLGLILQGILVSALIVKRRWSILPIFTLYSIFSFLSVLGLYAVYYLDFRRIYFWFYWANEGISVFLGLAVVYEIFRKLFTPYRSLRKFATHVFLVAVVLLVILAFVVVYLEAAGISIVVLIIEQAARILEVGTLLFFFLFARAFALKWRHDIFGIALGFGLVATVELVISTMRIQFGIFAAPTLMLTRSLAFVFSLVIWIYYVLWLDPAQVPTATPKSQLEKWNRAVMELIYQ